MSTTHKRGRRTIAASHQRHTKSLRTSIDDGNDDVSCTTRTSGLCSLLDDVLQHHVWPLLTDHDAIQLMQVVHAVCAYYEARAYGLKRHFWMTSDEEARRRFHHLITGPIRIVDISLSNISASMHKSILGACPLLVRLSIDLKSTDARVLKLLAAFIDTTPTLQYLHVLKLSGSFSHVISSIVAHKFIRTIVFHNCPFTIDYIKSVAQALEFNDTLTRLELTSCDFADDGIMILINALMHNTTLRTLVLGCNRIARTSTATALCHTILQPHSSLTALELTRNHSDDDHNCANDCAVELSATMCKLTAFKLVEPALGLRGITAICNALMKPDANVQNLELLDGEHAAHAVIYDMLGDNTSLRYLTVNDPFNEASASALGKALRRNNTLLSLDLGDNEYEEADLFLPHLISAMYINSTLLYLNFNARDEPVHIKLALSKNRYIQELRKHYEMKTSLKISM